MLASDGVPVLRDHFNDTRQILDRPPCHRDKLCPYSVSAMPKFDTDMVCRGHNPTPANAMPSTCCRKPTQCTPLQWIPQASLALVATTTRPSLADRQLGISQFIIPSLDRVTNYSMGGAEAGATVEADAECCKRPRITLPVKRRSVGLAARGSHTPPRATYIE
jgi:hypothetical protein